MMLTSIGLLLAAAIRASSFGFDPADSTEALQKAINAPAEKVIIDRQAGPWIVRPLFLRNGDKEIVIEDGVEIRAKAGEYQDVNDALFSVWGAKNVSIRGEGTAVLAMNKKDYQDRSKYRHSEWRHALSIRGGAENVGVSNLTVRASGGDGVYIFGACRIRLENLKCLDHHRQGISVISGAHVFARNCDFSETWGTAPACGIDFEPNRPDEEIVDFVFENCRFNGNQVSGVCFHLVQLADAGKPVSITFRDCEIRDNREFGITFTRTMRDTPGVTGFVLFERCSFVGNGESVMNLKNLSPEGLRIGFRDCLFDARATKSPAIVFNNGMSLFDFGAVAMRGCRLVRNPGQEPVTFQGAVGAGVIGTKGVLDVEENGTHSKFDLAEFAANHKPQPELRVGFEPSTFNAKDLVAPKASAPVAGPEARWCWRYEAPFVQYVPAAGEYEITILAQKSRNSSKEVTVELSDAIGTNLGKTSVNVESGKGTYVLKANGAGYYRLRVGTCGNFVDVKSSLPGHGFIASNRIQLFGCPGREYFFRVLPGTEDIRIEMVPDEGEPGRFQLVSPSGEIVADTGVADYRCILAYRRTGAKPGETWSVRMPLIKEDCRIRLGKGLVPVLSDSREAVVTTGEVPAEVKASGFGFDPADSTAFLQAALSSGAKRVVIDRMPGPWVSGPLKGASDQELVFEPGAEIVAKKGLFRGRTDSLLSYNGAKNVKISGGTLRMRRDDYRGAPYEESEWRHALLLHHVENVTVEKMLLTESGGDGIYLNDGRNVTVRDTVCDRNYRQGISVISAEDLLIERCRLTNTEGGLPMAGIDFEPNNPGERLVNCVMRDCVIEGNAGSGVDFALVWFNGTTRDVSLRFENVRIANNSKCVDLVSFNSPANAVRGDISFRNCSFGYDTSKVGIRLFESDDMPIRLHFEEGCRLVETTDGATVEKPIGEEWIAARFPHRNAEKVTYPPRLAHDFARHTVVHDAKPGEAVELSPLRLRFGLTLVFCAAKAGDVHFTLKQHRDPRRPTPTDNPIRLLDADGRQVGTYRTGGIGYEPSPLTVTVPAAGFYLLDFNISYLYPVTSDVPVAIDVSRRQANMNGLPGALWCFVPAETDSFAFFVAGDRGEERVKPTITDAAGNVVWTRDDVNSYVSYLSGRPANPGLWKIDFTRPTRGGLDDYKCEMHGLPPFLFLSPEKYWE